MSNYEAYIIFNKNSFWCGDRYTNETLYPTLIHSVGNDSQLSELLYKKYQLRVFNIVYSRVKNGKYHIFKQISLNKISSTIFFYVTGISRIFSITVYTLLKANTKLTRNHLLCELFLYSTDDRKLIKINNIWVANGNKNTLFKLMNTAKDYKDNKIHFTNNDMQNIINSYNILKSFDVEYYKIAQFTNKNETQIPHKAVFNITKNKEMVALETSLYKSIAMKHYGKEPIIYKYQGGIKQSTLLQQNVEDIKQISEPKYIPIKKIITGAYTNGYNKDIISNKYKDHINKMDEAHTNIQEIIDRTNWDTDTDTIITILNNIDDWNE